MEEINITNIFGIISSIFVVLGTLIAVIRGLRKKIANSLFSLVEIDEVNPKSSFYKVLHLNQEILNKLNEMNSEKIQQFALIDKHLENTNKGLLRLHILQALDHRPHDKLTIYNLYEEYKTMGGNSYVDKLIKDWENEKYTSVEKIVEDAIKKYSKKL